MQGQLPAELARAQEAVRSQLSCRLRCPWDIDDLMIPAVRLSSGVCLAGSCGSRSRGAWCEHCCRVEEQPAATTMQGDGGDVSSMHMYLRSGGTAPGETTTCSAEY